MATNLPRRAGFVCRSCQKFSAGQPVRRYFASQVASPPKQEPTSQSRKTISIPLRKRFAPQHPERSTPNKALKSVDPRNASAKALARTGDPAQKLKDFEKFVAHVQATDAAADHDDVLEALMDMYELSNVLVHGTSKISDEPTTTTTSSQGKDIEDALLDDLAEEKPSLMQTFTTAEPQQMTLSFRTTAATTLSTLSYDLLRSPKVYISEGMLQIYVRLLCQLGAPEYLPEIFHLYATKRIPRAESANPVKYSSPWPKMPKYAIPIDLAEAALESAILKKNLSLAVAIIDTTVGAPAFRTNRILRRASPLGLIVGATPLAAYAGADWVSNWQNTMDADMAKYTAIAGALAYIGTLSTIGFVAITTWNDQMQRVVWRPGTHLNSRWIREEERRLFDRLALAWGFPDKMRWGEEHGGEWLRLKDEVGTRDMILDKTDLMEGMQ